MSCNCRCLVAIILCACGMRAAVADSTAKTTEHAPQAPVTSGRAVGQVVPSFFVRAVTGPLRNRSVCYVCRNGDRPVVMLLARKIEPHGETLVKSIDGLVDDNRAVGLRSFVVVLADEPLKTAPQLQTLSFDKKISLPLTVATEAIAVPACQNVHTQAALTVVLYRHQRVVQRFAFRDGELDSKGIKTILEAARELVGEGISR